METETQEIKVGDKVRLVGGKVSPEWDGLRAVIERVGNGTNEFWVKMDAGDKRADGYTHEPFLWTGVTLRSEDDVAGDVPEPEPEDPELGRLRQRIGALETQLVTANSERTVAQNELEEFKQTVTRVAVKYAREHDWCSVVTEALSEMGLETTVEQRIRISGYVMAMVPVCGEGSDVELELRVNGDHVDTYDLEVEFDTDSY